MHAVQCWAVGSKMSLNIKNMRVNFKETSQVRAPPAFERRYYQGTRATNKFYYRYRFFPGSYVKSLTNCSVAKCPLLRTTQLLLNLNVILTNSC